MNGRRTILTRLLFGKQRTAILKLDLGRLYQDSYGFVNFGIWEQFGAEFRCRDCARIKWGVHEEAGKYVKPGVTRCLQFHDELILSSVRFPISQALIHCCPIHIQFNPTSFSFSPTE